MSPTRIMLVILFVMLATTSLTNNAQVSFHISPAASSFRLPIESGLTVYVIQGNNDTQHDHVGKAKYAFDFTVGTTNFVVTAAQGGTVIGADDSSTTGCSDVSCWTQANYVLIANDDGKTAALYLHLLHNSLKVRPGMHINQGDPLGQADTTGWATGPHLHFQIETMPNIPANPQEASGWWWTQSVPVSFSNPEVLAQDANGIPQEGQSFLVSKTPATTPTTTVNPTPSIPVPIPTPTPVVPTPSTLTTGQWVGMETNNPNNSPLDIKFYSVNGNTFIGVCGFFTANGTSEYPMQNGQITGNTITFTATCLYDGVIATYKGTVSRNTITGTWSEPNGANGTL